MRIAAEVHRTAPVDPGTVQVAATRTLQHLSTLHASSVHAKKQKLQLKNVSKSTGGAKNILHQRD
jgi:hypothetical protein